MTHASKLMLLTGVAIAYWLLVAHLSNVGEPWDADLYWTVWYPLALGFSAAGGFWLDRAGWMAGVVVVFAQAPAILAGGSVGASLWAAGLAILFASVVPAAASSELAHRIAVRDPERRS